MNVFLTQSDLQLLNNPDLTKLYHAGQLAAVGCIISGDFQGAQYWLELTLSARSIVYQRYGQVDPGHANIYNEVLMELDNVKMHVSIPYPYHFKSGTLVGNALQASIYVPFEMFPPRWNYSMFLEQQSARRARVR